jgi:hypothetical protein
VSTGLLRLPARTDGQRRAEGGRRLERLEVAGATSPSTVPLVSYVTVVRNACKTLPRTFASVKAQRWPAVEHIVIDGMSTDGTLQVIEAHAAQIDYYVSEPDTGLYDALNKALTLVRGSLVCVLNADDWLTPGAAAVAAAALQRTEANPLRPGPRLILSSAWLHNGRRRRLWLPGRLDAASWLRCPNLCHNGVYATPAALQAAGPYDTRLRIVADTRWMLAAHDAGVAVTHCAAPTVHYVTGGVSGDVSGHVRDCAQMLAQRFPQLADDEVWTLLHAFYPWTGNLAPFADRCPPDLGAALATLVHRHADDAALQHSLAAAGVARQLGQARRVRLRRSPAEALQRGLQRGWYLLRDALGA